MVDMPDFHERKTLMDHLHVADLLYRDAQRGMHYFVLLRGFRFFLALKCGREFFLMLS